MPTVVLESSERGIVTNLLDVSDIYDVYADNASKWARALSLFRNTTTDAVKTESGGSVSFAPREFLGIVLPLIRPIDGGLSPAVSELNSSTVTALRRLYESLANLDIRSAKTPEDKALFLLVARVSEEKRVFEDAP